MPTTTIAGHAVEVNDEGFLTRPDQWSDDLGTELARLIGIELTDDHWKLVHFLREDFAHQGETATLRRVSTRPAPRSSPSSTSSPASRPRRWPTSRACPSRRDVCDDHRDRPDRPDRHRPPRSCRRSTRRESQGRKLAIICSKGNLDMAYPGLILANAALGEGVETHLFFTFWGFDMINKKTSGDLKFTMLGNTATHMPQGLGGIPGMTHLATSQMKKAIADLDVPEVPEFLDQIVASGGHLWACRMSADMQHLTEDDLRDDVEGIISASDFIELTEGAQLLFI